MELGSTAAPNGDEMTAATLGELLWALVALATLAALVVSFIACGDMVKKSEL